MDKPLYSVFWTHKGIIEEVRKDKLNGYSRELAVPADEDGVEMLIFRYSAGKLECSDASEFHARFLSALYTEFSAPDFPFTPPVDNAPKLNYWAQAEYLKEMERLGKTPTGDTQQMAELIQVLATQQGGIQEALRLLAVGAGNNVAAQPTITREMLQNAKLDDEANQGLIALLSAETPFAAEGRGWKLKLYAAITKQAASNPQTTRAIQEILDDNQLRIDIANASDDDA